MTRANRLLKEELLEVKLTSMEKEEKCLLKIIGKEKKKKKKIRHPNREYEIEIASTTGSRAHRK